MNKYTELSDFEINLAVAHIALGKGSYDWCPDKKEVYFAGIDGGEFLHHGYFDPCNNPYYAMPIIIENKISLRAPTITDRWKAEFVDEYGNYVGYIRALNKNPLRAAMEVFLMMKDEEDEENEKV
ncbi:phage protein NinX family protein [Proteus mirabilis]|uniref:phage protein NinX family protein n=1 Tax=Proteus mirabilis TaxID=584 RepID=UPI0034E4D171